MNTGSIAYTLNTLSRRVAVLVSVLALSFTVSIPCIAAEPLPLAIKGYDPVAYYTFGKPIPGLPEIEYEWNGYRYRFANAKDRELFKADPARYAPQFENYCAMALSKGELVVADPENWLISGGKLYLFG
jgi:YHS domain-containing protein